MHKTWNFLFALALISTLHSCGWSSTSEPVTTDTPEEITADIKPTETIAKVSDKSTLDGFWTIFKKAVADRDIATIESLYTEEASVIRFSDKDYQEKIANSTVSDVKESLEKYKGKKVYEFRMTFLPEFPEEGQEESMTTVYLQKNDKGEFEIFSVIEAG